MSGTFVEDLRVRFRETSAMRLTEMAELLTLIESDPANAPAVKKLAQHFHGLAGMGGTYGFPRVSQLGDEAEESIQPLVRSGAAPDAAMIARWRTLLRELETELRMEGSTPPLPKIVTTPAPASAFDVLIVEDETELAKQIAEALENEGIAVRVTGSRSDAVVAMDARVPDAVIIDIRLPDGSGHDVLEDLRVRRGGEAVGAILMSAAGGFEEKVRALRSGADAFIGKPLDLTAVVRRVTAFRSRKEHPARRILAVEDDVTTGAMLRGILGAARYDVQICRNPADFETMLVAFDPDLLLMDVQLSHDVSGHDLVRYVRQSERFGTLPIIIVTSDSERRAVLDGTSAGADLLVTKPVDWDLLLSHIAARLERATSLREITDRDPLTGVLTRRAFEGRVQTRAQEGIHGARPPVLVLLDLDHFKDINDRHGHAAGDRVLATVGTLLRRSIRQSDVAGRFGGEEFVLLLEGLHIDDAVKLCERLMEELGAAEHGLESPPTFSAGVAALRDSYEEAFRRADAALYEAKRGGRARVVAA